MPAKKIIPNQKDPKAKRTPKSKVQVLLTQEVYEIVKEISHLSDMSMSAIVTQLMVASKDGLILIRDSFKAAHNSEPVKQVLSAMVDKAHAMSNQMQKDLDDMDLKD